MNIEVPPNFGIQEEVATDTEDKVTVVKPFGAYCINTRKQLIEKICSKTCGIKNIVISKTCKIASILEQNSDILQASLASRMNGKITTHLHIIPNYWMPRQIE